MNQLLQSISDPSGLEPLHRVVDAVRNKLPASAAPRRDEVIALLSASGYTLLFLNGQLHVAGIKL